jgi:hypothetical protein
MKDVPILLMASAVLAFLSAAVVTVMVWRPLKCLFGFHAPGEGRSMGTSIARKRTNPRRMFRYDYDCPACGRTYTRWR